MLYYHQCTNIECSATFRTIDSVDGVIRAAPEPSRAGDATAAA
ncbi:hypothetical protein B9P82_10755 [Citrobacter sp. L55]|nr:hypothetical protein B9P82_10755 [Citrobacter sp. L55]QLS67104.1 ogr/Delta-like zinc finger family protein [Citrobacter sp. RHBSTW-00881]HCU0799159.1 ogr/Delta-like zinc finger family protein [Citrobacter braakii]